MAIVLLPPGNKFKILNSYELIQLAEVLKSAQALKESIRHLEGKWRMGDDVFDIDLLSTTASPLSELENTDVGESGDIVKRRKEIAREIQKRRRNYRRKPQKKIKKQLPLIEEIATEVVETPEVITFDQCAQGPEEWNSVFKEFFPNTSFEFKLE